MRRITHWIVMALMLAASLPAFCEEEVNFSMTDYEQLRQVFAEYLKSHRDKIKETVPSDVVPLLDNSVGTPFIDDQSNVRMGAWLLEVHRNRRVLTFRPVPPGTCRVVAPVRFNKKSQWVVGNLQFEIIHRAK